MKILFYTPFYLPQSQAAAVRSFWFVQILKNNSHSVHVLSSIKSTDSSTLCINPADNKASILKRFFFEIMAGINLFLKILTQKNDLIILSSPPFITIYIAHWAARIKKTKYILDIRDLYPDVYFVQGLLDEKSPMGLILRSITLNMYKNAHAIITVNETLKEKINSNAHVIMNGYDKDTFFESVEKYPDFTVIFHGNMGKIQNLKTILSVAEKLKQHQDIKFVFIGEGPQAKLLQDSKLKNISYLGEKDYKEIPSLISKAHIGISARQDDLIGSEAIPVKVYEYLGVNIPVIVTPPSKLFDSFVDKGVYCFKNNEIEQMANLILDLKKNYQHPVLKQDVSRQAQAKMILKVIS